jgi:hypothetical protein
MGDRITLFPLMKKLKLAKLAVAGIGTTGHPSRWSLSDRLQNPKNNTVNNREERFCRTQCQGRYS